MCASGWYYESQTTASGSPTSLVLTSIWSRLLPFADSRYFHNENRSGGYLGQGWEGNGGKDLWLWLSEVQIEPPTLRRKGLLLGIESHLSPAAGRQRWSTTADMQKGWITVKDEPYPRPGATPISMRGMLGCFFFSSSSPVALKTIGVISLQPSGKGFQSEQLVNVASDMIRVKGHPWP